MSPRKTRGRGGRGLFEIRPGQHRPKVLRNGAIFVFLAVALVYVLHATPTFPGFATKGQKVTFEVANGINIRPGSTPVRVNGVEVGSVEKVERAPSGRGVRVETLVREDSGVSVRKDASVSLRWRTVLGRNIYVDLRPGSPSAPVLAESEIIPRSRTETQTELDQALEPFDATGRDALKTIIEEFDKGFGSAEAYKATVKELGPALRSLGPGLRAFRGREANDLQQMIQGTSRTLGALASDEVALGKLIDNGSVALGVTAAQSQNIQGILATAPGALQETRATMARLRTTLDVLDPVAAELRPGARQLPASADDASVLLNAAAPLLRDAKPTVRALRPAVQDLTKLTRSGNDVMAAANPVLDSAIYPILPYLRTTDTQAKRKMYEMLGPFVSAANSAVAHGDKLGTIANFEAGVGEGSLPAVSPCQAFLTDPTVQEKINCDLVGRILVAAYTGQNPADVELRKSGVKNSQVAPLFKDKDALKEPLANLKRTLEGNKKEAGR